MTTRKNRALALISAASLLALAACSSGGNAGGGDGGGDSPDVPGVTDTTVTIGTHTPLTGKAAAGFSSISKAASAYFDYINDKGGIHGREIEFIVKDDGYNPATTGTVVRELVLQDEIFALIGGLGTPTHSSVIDYLNDNEIPDLFVASGSPMWDDPEKYPYTFGYNSEYTDEAAILATYAQEQFPDGTYCLFGQDDDFGTDFKAGLESVLGADGLTEFQTYSVSMDNVGAQINAMKSAGCDVNFLASINGFTAMAVGTAAQLQYAPQWLSSSSGGDYGTLSTYLGENTAPLLEGFISTFYLSLETSPEDPWTQHFQKVNDEYNAGTELGGNEIYGMNMALQFAEALAAAGENPTREALIEAIEGGKVKGSGLVPVGYSAEDHTGHLGVQLSRVEAGVQAYFGTPYIVEDGAVKAYEGERPAITNEGVPQ